MSSLQRVLRACEELQVVPKMSSLLNCQKLQQNSIQLLRMMYKGEARGLMKEQETVNQEYSAPLPMSTIQDHNPFRNQS